MSTIYGRYRFADDWIEKSHPENGVFRVYWKDVKGFHSGDVTLDPDESEGLRWEWYYKDGKRADGISRGWWPSGNLKCEWNWKNGKLDGLWTQWFDNGQKWYERTYKNGEFYGLYTVWFDNGQKAIERTYKNGKKVGRWTEWDENGEIKQVKEFGV